MNKRIFALLAAVCLLFTGCASLLERSYSAVEPYTDRYWDTTAEDTLKAENYQDLVNSLLMVIEQRSEECVIRYYASAGADSYAQSLAARREVLNETILGSYLLDSISVIYTSNEDYCTLTYSMSYRKNAQDVDTLMALSDTQSLVDLLRLSVREEHDALTARFISKTSRSEVIEAVEDLWEELWLDEMEAMGLLPIPEETSSPDSETPDGETPDGETPDSEAVPPSEEPSPDDEPPPPPENEEGAEDSGSESEDAASPPPSDDTSPEDPNAPEGELPPEEIPPEDSPDGPETPVIEIPPCPWEIRFYPDQESAEIVEIILK